MKPTFEKIIEVVEKYQDLLQVKFLKIEDNTLQEVDEEKKRKKEKKKRLC